MAGDNHPVRERRDPAEILSTIPDSPGVYLYRDEAGKVIYVGKAKSLRKRVGSYFNRPDPEPKTAALLERFRTIETILTDSEVEAFSLENSLIKKHRPRFNILLRDDKTYPYVKVTTGEVWPRAFITRRIKDDGHSYFGPIIPGGRARHVMQMLTRYFRIRTCRIEIDGKLPRPCLYYDIHACPGPCVDGLTTRTEYAAAVEEAILFLKGKSRELVPRLEDQMNLMAQREDFELAAHYRDLIRAVQAQGAENKTESASGEDLDAFGVHEEAGDVALAVLVMRNGRIVDRRQLFWEGLAPGGRFDSSEFLTQIVPQFYSRTDFIPREIHLPAPLVLDAEEEHSTLEAWLSDRAGRRVFVRVPERGEKRRRVELAEQNARAAHTVRFRRAGEEKDSVGRLQKALSLPSRPDRIEGFDISHLQGHQTYASLVVFVGGKPARAEYRLFSISSGKNDDFASLAEAVTRRYSRQAEEGNPMPDLVLIDGGRGQLGAAAGALARLELQLPLASIAKKQEEVFVPGRFRPLRLSRRDLALQLLQRIRDESHRFAISAHRRRRGREAFETRLEEIPGLGPVRIRSLLRRFGDPDSVARAPLEELEEVLGRTLAGKIQPLLQSLAVEPISTPGNHEPHAAKGETGEIV